MVRSGRGMHQQWAHQDCVAGRCLACDWRDRLRESRDALREQPAQPVRTRQHAKSSVYFATRIQMDANRQHRFQNRGRRLNVRHTALHRPRTVAVNIHPPAHRDRQILMPRYQPVGRRSRQAVNRGNGFEQIADREQTSASSLRRTRNGRKAPTTRSSALPAALVAPTILSSVP
jgi:hypothetical protein